MNHITKIAIAGAGGKMGRQLITAVSQIDGAILTAAFERTGSSLIGADAGEVAGISKQNVLITDDIESSVALFDVLIDFTRPEGTIEFLDICRLHHKKMIIGTTGLSESQKDLIAKASKEIGVVFSANYSVGVNVVLKLLEKTAKIMGSYADIEIVEAHHRHKVDAPSGTALAMGESIASAMNINLNEHAVYAREGYTGERVKNSIGFATIRAGDIIGDHTAIFADIGERVEITHKASSRMTFANGAVRAALWLSNKDVGLYDMKNVLELDAL